MARRRGKPGDYLVTDDYTGWTTYRSRAQFDYWGSLTERPLQRNLQEIAVPLNDPQPVPVYRGPQYEHTTECDFELQPQFIGRTNIPFPNTWFTQVMGLNPAIPNMSVGCTFIVAPNEASGALITEDGDIITTESGDAIGVT